MVIYLIGYLLIYLFDWILIYGLFIWLDIYWFIYSQFGCMYYIIIQYSSYFFYYSFFLFFYTSTNAFTQSLNAFTPTHWNGIYRTPISYAVTSLDKQNRARLQSATTLHGRLIVHKLVSNSKKSAKEVNKGGKKYNSDLNKC